MPNCGQALRVESRAWPSCSSDSARSTGDWERPRSQTFNKSAAVGAYSMWRSRRVGEGRLARLGHFDVAFPAFVFQFDVLDEHGVGVGVEVSERLEFRNPAAINLVSDDELAGFVIDLDDDVLAKILERNFRAKPGAEVPDLVSPLLEFLVVRDAAFERDSFVFGAARGFAAAAGVAAFAVLDDLGGALERAALADPGDVFAVPFDPELEVFVGIETLGR